MNILIADSIYIRMEHYRVWLPPADRVWVSSAVKKFDEHDKDLIPWEDVMQNIWYKVIHSRRIKTENGEIYIFKLEGIDGVIIKAWATKLITYKMKKVYAEIKAERKSVTTFIISLGKKTIHETDTIYDDFKIINYACPKRWPLRWL